MRSSENKAQGWCNMLNEFLEQSSKEQKLQLLLQLEALNDTQFEAIIAYLRLVTQESDHQ